MANGATNLVMPNLSPNVGGQDPNFLGWTVVVCFQKRRSTMLVGCLMLFSAGQ